MITLSEIIERDKRPPSVTVYMLCYNHEKYIDKAVKSVLMQKTNFPVNIVIHDDASPDSSAEIIRRYESENPNITAIIEENNCMLHGKTFFQNMIPYFTGKYIAYCECDDYWLDENKLQIQVDYLENNPDCIGVYSNCHVVDKFGKPYKSENGIIPFEATPEGDYTRNYIYGVRHQLASCVHRNFWQFMTPDEINFYVSISGQGDEKLNALCVHLGRVHHFSRKFTAYRFINNSGSSYSAYIAALSEFQRYARHVKSVSEIYRMLEYFFGKKYYRKYIFVLGQEIRGRLRFHRSFIKDAPLAPCYQLKNIPFFMYIAFPFVFPFYIAYGILRKK